MQVLSPEPFRQISKNFDLHSLWLLSLSSAEFKYTHSWVVSRSWQIFGNCVIKLPDQIALSVLLSLAFLGNVSKFQFILFGHYATNW